MIDNDDPSLDSQDYIDTLLARWTTARPDFSWPALAVTGRIRLLALLVDGITAAIGERQGIKRGELEILIALCRSGERLAATPTELAQQVWITAASITRRVDQLVKQGLVERERESKDDRREVLIRLTSRGQAVAGMAAGEIRAAESNIVAGLEPEEQRMLTELMRKLLLKFDMQGNVSPGRLLRAMRASAEAGEKGGSGRPKA